MRLSWVFPKEWLAGKEEKCDYYRIDSWSDGLKMWQSDMSPDDTRATVWRVSSSPARRSANVNSTRSSGSR